MTSLQPVDLAGILRRSYGLCAARGSCPRFEAIPELFQDISRMLEDSHVIGMDSAAGVDHFILPGQSDRRVRPPHGSADIDGQFHTARSQSFAKQCVPVRIKRFIVVMCMCITDRYLLHPCPFLSVK